MSYPTKLAFFPDKTFIFENSKLYKFVIYKLKNGKSVPSDYLKVSPHLKMLMPPKKGTAISPEAVKIQEEMKKYCWNAYVDALSHPFTPNKILRPDLEKYPNLKDYDLNALSLLLKL